MILHQRFLNLLQIIFKDTKHQFNLYYSNIQQVTALIENN